MFGLARGDTERLVSTAKDGDESASSPKATSVVHDSEIFCLE